MSRLTLRIRRVGGGPPCASDGDPAASWPGGAEAAGSPWPTKACRPTVMVRRRRSWPRPAGRWWMATRVWVAVRTAYSMGPSCPSRDPFAGGPALSPDAPADSASF